MRTPPPVKKLAELLRPLGWVTDLFVAGSMATGDYRAGVSDLDGYWALAARRPWWWLDPALADLGLTSMARGRHSLATGDLLTKTAAIDDARAPGWLRADLLARRSGRPARSPRLRTAWIAWRDACRTTAAAPRRTAPRVREVTTACRSLTARITLQRTPRRPAGPRPRVT